MYSGGLDLPSLQVSPGSEPMNLGSPASSPTGTNPSAYGGPQYLPGFLIGETGSANNSRMWSSPGANLSPTKTRTMSSPYMGGVASSPPKPLFSPIVTIPTNGGGNRNYGRPSQADKHGGGPGGPPVQGLFSHTSPIRPSLVGGSTNTSVVSNRETSNLFTPVANNSALERSVISRNDEEPSFIFPTSPAQIDPFYTQGQSLTSNDKLDETWVTVFGFPPSAASYILQQFYHYGTIINHKLPPNGNWMHLHYQNKLQAKVALSKNGKIFGNSYMVGVAPCIEKSVMRSSNTSTVSKEASVISPSRTFTPQSLNRSAKSPFLTKDYSVLLF